MVLIADRRAQQGGILFLLSLFVFFVTGIVSFVLYASWRPASQLRSEKLPESFLTSTLCLVVVSVALHLAVRAAQREQRSRGLGCSVLALAVSLLFLVVQARAMWQIAGGYANQGISSGLAGIMLALAMLHAVHVIGGVAALVIVTRRWAMGTYDHERNWAVRFTALYWHFLDAVWICMLIAFWSVSGGF